MLNIVRDALNRLEMSFVDEKQLRINAVRLQKKRIIFSTRCCGEAYSRAAASVFPGSTFTSRHFCVWKPTLSAQKPRGSGLRCCSARQTPQYKAWREWFEPLMVKITKAKKEVKP